MPKKQTKRGHGRIEEKEEQDNLDELKSLGSEMSDDAEHFTSVEDEVNMILDDLQAKNGKVRCRAIRSFNKTMAESYQYSLLDNKKDTIALYLGPSIKKGSSEECVLACQALCLIALTLGEDSHSIFKDYSAVLEVNVKNKSKSGSIRAACLQTLAVLSFITSVDSVETAQVMQLCHELAVAGRKESTEIGGPGVTEQALDSFGLLATSLPASQLAASVAKTYLPTWVDLLEHKCLEVRSSAGENIALVAEAAAAQGEELPVDFDSLMEKLEDLATDHSKRKAKGEKKKQRATFREILATVDENEPPSRSLTLNRTKHTISGWVLHKQLEAITVVLGSGLSGHFARNPLLSDILGIDAMVDDEIVEEDTQSKRSRQAGFKASAAANYINKQNARSKKMAFAHYGGED
eukprot:CAMPEP_0175095184 /NCGR_PEP_ID=MMETSP0086_2-20121207/4011_1 /TAXON_ID=136419 /ORGANISM="Unknown Unknown, Strain D1" /LENGTH=406 /DNA_ID=CAMNT_0016368397 /DNA_START=44 /DNA_END=1264 /DNA_ORIENTATION=-